MADKPIRVGFVGAGANTRKHHIPNLKAQPLIAQLVPAPHTLEVDRVLVKLLAEGYAGEVHAVEVQGTQQGRFAELGDALHWRQDIRLSGNNIMNMGIWYEAIMRWLGPAKRVMA